MCGSKLKTKLPIDDLRLQSEFADAVQILSSEKLQSRFNCNAINCKETQNAMSTEMRRNDIHNETIDV